jgi:FADH2 O2-dependent halogenase
VRRWDVAIAGSGLGGSILARALNRRGCRVLLIERAHHPRFTVGESSTPLAALSLERLARDYELPDLHNMASYERWTRHHPDLRRGLKRGFTFYRHQAGSNVVPTAADRTALLVAASPNDRVADAHWLRADVDHYLVRQAQAEGVDYFDRSTIIDIEIGDSEVEIGLAPGAAHTAIRADVLVDATGKGGLVKELLGVGDGRPLETRSALLYGHFRNVIPLFELTAAEEGAPYPAPWSAVHHLIDEGWIYELRFDDGLISAGALLREPPKGEAAEVWGRLIARYPVLHRAFSSALPVVPLTLEPRVQHRMAAAAGHRWVALPHTYAFVDPFYSSGIAWTLRGVERLAELLADPAARGAGAANGSAFRRYAELLELESEQLDTLISTTYRAFDDFELFAAYAMTYFVSASWAESRERLLQPEGAAWEALLGSSDSELAGLFTAARDRLQRILNASGSHADRSAAYWRWIAESTAPRDIAAADRWGPTLHMPVDLDALVDRAALLGLDRATVVARLPLLRGDPS